MVRSTLPRQVAILDRRLNLGVDREFMIFVKFSHVFRVVLVQEPRNSPKAGHFSNPQAILHISNLEDWQLRHFKAFSHTVLVSLCNHTRALLFFAHVINAFSTVSDSQGGAF